MNHPRLYEINTRVWLKRFDTLEREAGLSDVPVAYWKNLAALGFDYIWLMGVWDVCDDAIEKYCFADGLVNEYKEALDDFKSDDVIGSPFAINNYIVNPKLGSAEDIVALKEKLNSLNLKLILDFIPNHFNSESDLIKTNHGLFVQVSKNNWQADTVSCFKDPHGRELYFAHGRDPFFPAWTDTVQVNYQDETARAFMMEALKHVSRFCDGVRCDMAMLMLNDVFEQTWGDKTKDINRTKPKEEFWKSAIDNVKQEKPGFIFLAEAYWDLEWKLQESGFDYTYDKKLMDRLIGDDVYLIKEHLKADRQYQNKSVRFIENHDEQRAAVSLGDLKSRAAALLISTLPGMCFCHDGQLEGKEIKLPVQLGREPVEQINKSLCDFYRKLLTITKDDILKYGDWQFIDSVPAGEDDSTYENIIVLIWQYKNDKMLVVVNYSDVTSYCRIKIDYNNGSENILFEDLLNETSYDRCGSEINAQGLFIKLEGWAGHIFKVIE